MTRRKRKWLLGIAVFVIAIAVGLFVSYLRLLPMIIRREVNAAFASVGLQNVSFEVQHASLFGTRIEGTGGEEQEVGIGAVSIRYSPWDAINGELKSITVSNARLEIDLDQPVALRPTTRPGAATGAGASFELPFERLELVTCALVLKRGERELRLPINGSILRRTETGSAADVTIASAIEESDLHISAAIDGAASRATLTASAADVRLPRLLELLPRDVARAIDDVSGNATFALDYAFDSGQSTAALQVALSDVVVDAQRAWGVSVRGVSGAITFDELLIPATPPQQMLHIDQIDLTGQTLRSGTVAFHVRGPKQLNVGELRFNWGGGMVRIAEPLTIDPSDPQVIATTLVLERVGMPQVVALVTGGRATGTGSVSGSLPFSIDLTEPGEPQVHIGEGTLRADSPGQLALGEASEDFGDLIAQSDPTFESDPLKRELRESVVEAMHDFEYHLLEVSFRRTRDDVVAAMKIHGRGRTGAKVPLHLGVNVEGFEELLNYYLVARSRVLGDVKIEGG